MAIDFILEPELDELREPTAEFVRAAVLPAQAEPLRGTGAPDDTLRQTLRQAAREAAWTLHQGRSGKQESSVAKTFTAEAVGRIVDRAVRVCGALGISGDLPLSAYPREVRPLRIHDGLSGTDRWSTDRRALRTLEGAA